MDVRCAALHLLRVFFVVVSWKHALLFLARRKAGVLLVQFAFFTVNTYSRRV